MKERNKAVPAVYLILKRGRKILLARRANTGYYDGWYSLPAGHVEYQELPLEALIRETKEEIGLDLHKKDLKLVHLMYRAAADETGDRVDMFYLARYREDYDPTNQEPEKCDQLAWFSYKELPENMVQNVRQAVEGVFQGDVFSELSTDQSLQNLKEYQEERKGQG